MKGKLDITSVGVLDAVKHGLTIYGWHVFSYAVILAFAALSHNLPTIVAFTHTKAEYLPLIAATVNSIVSSVIKWMTTHGPIDTTVVSTDGVNPAGFTIA